MKTLAIYLIFPILLIFSVITRVFVAFLRDRGYQERLGLNKIHERVKKKQVENTKESYRSVFLTSGFKLQKW